MEKLEQAITDGAGCEGAAPYYAGSKHQKTLSAVLQTVASDPGGLGESRSRCWVGREAGWQCHWP